MLWMALGGCELNSAPPDVAPPSELPTVAPTPAPAAEPPATAPEPKAKGLESQGVVLGPAVVMPSTHSEEVNARLPITLDKLIYCARKARTHTPLLKGSYLFEFEVGQDGMKTPPDMVEQTTEHPIFETCVISRLRKFGRVSHTEDVSVVLPLHISPAEIQDQP